MNLAPLLDEALDWRFRAFPTSAAGVRLGDVPSQRWNLFDSGFFFPAMVLKEAALEHNLRVMARFCAERGALLAPHGKTTMAPQLFARQLAAGAWGLTAATVEHARVYRAFGVPRILLANELVCRDEAAWVAAQLAADPELDFLCYVDSPAGVGLLSEVFAGAPRRLGILVELGVPGGRAGVRTTDDALALAHAVARAPGLALRGVAAFEGILGGERAPAALEAVDGLCDRLVALAGQVLASKLGGQPELILSAGGSAFPDRVVERLGVLARTDPNVKVVLRSGCYVTHDDGFYENVSPFSSSSSEATRLRPALELWAAVLSRPEPGLAIVGFGKRDAPFDLGLPTPRAVRGASGQKLRAAGSMAIAKLNDQHAYLTLPPDDPLAPGELLSCGISHPCLAFDKWPLLPVVDDDYTVVDAIRTYF